MVVEPLKKNASNLNPNSAADREKFASEIAKYFIDPGKKFKLELSKKEKENEELKIQLGDVFNMLTALKEQYSVKENEMAEIKTQHKEEMTRIKEGHNTEITGIKDVLSEVTGELKGIKAEQKRKESEKEYSDWQRPSKIAFVLFIFLLLFGILQLLPNWKLNFPAKLVEYINEIRPENEAKFRLWVAIDGFLTTSLIVTLFIFSYQRLFNKEKMKNKRNELGL